MSETYQIQTIGHVRRADDGLRLEILEPFRSGLKQLGHFSHVVVLWWADRCDNEEMRSQLQCRPPYAEEHLTGVFATRSEYRPNPIALTTCPIVGVDEEAGIVQVAGIDAYDGTRILDLKAYFPVTDRVKEARIPEWIPQWGEWLPDTGLEIWE